jgi:hypothetical protein
MVNGQLHLARFSGDALLKFLATIAFAVMLPVLAWMVHAVVDHGERIAVIEQRQDTSKELLEEIRDDIKELAKR